LRHNSEQSDVAPGHSVVPANNANRFCTNQVTVIARI
jgi:hypothetical protein